MTKATFAISESMTARELLRLNTHSIKEDFSVANTPLFLLRKLRANLMVQNVAYNASTDAILQALQKTIEKRPKAVRTAILPYIYIVALGIKNEQKALKVAASWASPHHIWYAVIIDAIMSSQKATTMRTYRVSPVVKMATNPTSGSKTAILSREK